jgi:hypothetical protein
MIDPNEARQAHQAILSLIAGLAEDALDPVSSAVPPAERLARMSGLRAIGEEISAMAASGAIAARFIPTAED